MSTSPTQPTEPIEPEDMPFSPLLAAIVTNMFSESAALSNRIQDNLRYQLDEANARLTAIEVEIHQLFAGPYMPTPSAVLRALYPTREIVDQYRGFDHE